MLHDELEEWDGGVGTRLKRERIYVYIRLIHLAVQHKPIQHCKATIVNKKENLLSLMYFNHISLMLFIHLFI